MKHFPIIIGIAITCVLSAVLNLVILRMTDINIFSFKIWFIIPVGAIGVGFASASGGILAARVFNAVPNWIDAFVMVICAAVTMWLIYYLDYVTMVLDDGQKVADFMTFGDYVEVLLTKTHMLIGRGARDVGEVGEAGYWLAVLEFAGFLVGGLSSFLVLKDMERCPACKSYLRKLKSKTSGVITIDDAGNIFEHFKTGDAATIIEILAWTPPNEKKFAKGEKAASITYDLLGCPKCKTEQIVASVSVFNGKEWAAVDGLKTRRDLSDGFSLRSEFA